MGLRNSAVYLAVRSGLFLSSSRSTGRHLSYPSFLLNVKKIYEFINYHKLSCGGWEAM